MSNKVISFENEYSFELEQDRRDINDGLDHIEGGISDANTLENLAAKVGAMQSTGGLDSNTAEVVGLAVEAIYTRLGITRKPLPALEGFSNKDTRTHSTQYAIEGFIDTVKDIWAAIMAAFMKVIEWVKSFFGFSKKKEEQQLAKAEKINEDIKILKPLFNDVDDAVGKAKEHKKSVEKIIQNYKKQEVKTFEYKGAKFLDQLKEGNPKVTLSQAQTRSLLPFIELGSGSKNAKVSIADITKVLFLDAVSKEHVIASSSHNKSSSVKILDAMREELKSPHFNWYIDFVKGKSEDVDDTMLMQTRTIVGGTVIKCLMPKRNLPSNTTPIKAGLRISLTTENIKEYDQISKTDFGVLSISEIEDIVTRIIDKKDSFKAFEALIPDLTKIESSLQKTYKDAQAKHLKSGSDIAIKMSTTGKTNFSDEANHYDLQIATNIEKTLLNYFSAKLKLYVVEKSNYLKAVDTLLKYADQSAWSYKVVV